MTPTMDGNWEITGLPEEVIVAIFVLAQIDSYLTGLLDTSNGSSQNFAVAGSNNYPTVRLHFKLGLQVVFTFQGSFTDENTIEGSLSGQYTGPATLSRAGV